jgi:Zn-dependent protease with chaperone function
MGYKLIDDKQINAWCMPGGKLLFTLNFTCNKNDAGLATVMGHEVSCTC